MTSSREEWRNGWDRYGAEMQFGASTCCAGCGRILGTASVDFTGVGRLPPEPNWPFDEQGCPICALSAQIKEGPEDKLTKRLVAAKAARAVGPVRGVRTLQRSLMDFIRTRFPGVREGERGSSMRDDPEACSWFLPTGTDPAAGELMDAFVRGWRAAREGQLPPT